VVLFSLGWRAYLFYVLCIYISVHSSPYLCVCGDDRITYYPGVDDLTGEPGDA